MSVIEVRIYTIHEGKREEFVWLRRFDSQEERWRRRDEFYGSDLWRNRLGLRANPPMKDSSNVIAVEPTPGSAIQ